MARIHKPSEQELSPQQVEALGLLLSGHTITHTAAALGVARETVSRWRHSDPGFEAAYNEGLLSQWEASHKKLIDTQAKAIDKLAELLDNSDPAVALKAAAALVRIEIPKPRGSTSPHAVARDQSLRAF